MCVAVDDSSAARNFLRLLFCDFFQADTSRSCTLGGDVEEQLAFVDVVRSLFVHH